MPSSDSLAVTGNSNEQAKLITVKTDVLDFRINTRGGTIDEGLTKLAYPPSLIQNPSVYWKTTPQFLYRAPGGFNWP